MGLSLGAAALAPSTGAAPLPRHGAVPPLAPRASGAQVGRAQELTTVRVRRNHGFKLALDATNGPNGSFSSLTLTLEKRSHGRGVGSSLETTTYIFNRRISFAGAANLASAKLHGLLLRRRGWIDMTFRATRHAVGIPVPKGCVGTPGVKRRGILRGSLTLNADRLGTVRLRVAGATLSVQPSISDCYGGRQSGAEGTALETNDTPGRHAVYLYATKPARRGLVSEGVVIADTGRSYSFSYSYTALAPRSDYTFPANLSRALVRGVAGIHGRVKYSGTRARESSEGAVTGRLSVAFATIGTVKPLAGGRLTGNQFRY